ncbi:hypothetical protein ACIBK8_21560 [Streptomyces sp. NPDC050161]|uniref:hypothetical protein n=1 Tax=Streptomyces sp. NPDC050161 TaxID=3365604 RepID=UPI0037A8BF25
MTFSRHPRGTPAPALPACHRPARTAPHPDSSPPAYASHPACGYGDSSGATGEGPDAWDDGVAEVLGGGVGDPVGADGVGDAGTDGASSDGVGAGCVPPPGCPSRPGVSPPP